MIGAFVRGAKDGGSEGARAFVSGGAGFNAYTRCNVFIAFQWGSMVRAMTGNLLVIVVCV